MGNADQQASAKFARQDQGEIKSISFDANELSQDEVIEVATEEGTYVFVVAKSDKRLLVYQGGPRQSTARECLLIGSSADGEGIDSRNSFVAGSRLLLWTARGEGVAKVRTAEITTITILIDATRAQAVRDQVPV